MKVAMLRFLLLLCIFVRLEFAGFAQPDTITTYAGSSLLVNGAQAVTQSIDDLTDVVADGSGGFYFSTHNWIYRVAADGTVRLIAGVELGGYSGDGGAATSAQLGTPSGMALDAAGNLFIADSGNNRIRKITAAGIISTVAGNGTSGYGGDGGPATSAQLDRPSDVAVDSAGNLYIACPLSNRIRKVTTAGIISTFAGNGVDGYGGDGGPATAAQLYYPSGVAVDSAGNLFIADSGNNRIRKVWTVGIISTLAGNGSSGYSGDAGSAAAAQLNYPIMVAVDSADNLYISDNENNRIRKVTTAGIISTVAGIGSWGYSGDGAPATAARLATPHGVAVDSAGNFYIADYYNNRIRKVTTAGIISTVAGNGARSFSGDGGPAASAQLDHPLGVAVDSAGSLYITDSYNNRIRKVTTMGIISAVAGGGNGGLGDGGPAASAKLSHPVGVAVDSVGDLYVSDSDNCRIRKITTAGIISTVAGNSTSILVPGGEDGGSYTFCFYDGDGGTATSAHLNHPTGVAVDSAGNLYIADTNNNRIRKVTTAGIISTVAGNGTYFGGGGDGGPATSAQLSNPSSVAIHSEGNLYIADTYNNRIRKVTTAGTISTVAGNGTVGYSGDGGVATSAQLYSPWGIAVDSAGNLYISDTYNNRIRKVTTAGTISTVAGGGNGGFGDGGPATLAQLYYPSDVAITPAGSIYIADYYNDRIRKVVSVVSPMVTTALISSIAQSTASGGGNVTSDGGGSVTARGVCWSTSANPTIADVCTSDGVGTGVFTSSLVGLTANTNYHARTYVTNSVGTAYGLDLVFTTLASLTTTAVTSIAQATATGGGTINSDGGAPVTARGVCWGTSSNPTTGNTCTTDGGGTGVFTSSLTGLAANASYHVRAYAINPGGTAYGADVIFTTLAPDFQIGIASGGTNSAIVDAGSSAIYSLAVTGMSFTGSVAFSCSGLPTASHCSVSPNPLSVSGPNTVPFSVTISTTARSGSTAMVNGPDFFPPGVPAQTAVLCLASLCLTLSKKRKWRLSIAFSLLSAFGLAGCGGGKSSSKQGTPTGTYTIVLSATSGTISHSNNLTMTVK